MSNIVKALMHNRTMGRTEPLYQYDYGQVLQFVGLNLPVAYEVHFSNQMHGVATTQIGNADGVAIPDTYLTTGQTIYAWVYLHTGEDDGETEYAVTIPVIQRASISNATPTPVQQDAITEAIAALNSAVESAEAARDAWESMSAEATTLPAGSSATASYASGVLSLGIPIGATGDTGPAWQDDTERVSSLDTTVFGKNHIIEAVGAPTHVSDVTPYSSYGITDSGWYIFARIAAKTGKQVTVQTTVTGATGYIATVGANHIDVAVRFGTTAQSQAVTINWGTEIETFIFKATDLAVSNLDYRTTFYLYDLDNYVTWAYTLTTDTTFSATKNYYTENGGVYTKAPESVKYTLTGDATFASGKTYYTEADGIYTAATVTEGATVPADTYYELTSVPAETYYNHSKATFSGMTRNVTYKFDQIIDCPIEIVLPEIDDAGYGAWFEIQLRYDGYYSCTLLPPDGVKIGTVSTQSQTAGINVIDLQYTGVGGVAMWSLLNTHSNIPT